jgi:hypothetical protein
MDYLSDMDLRPLLEAIAEEHHLTLQRCGLNADWSVDAFMLSPGNPNTTQGAFYIIEEETSDHRWALVRRWYEADPGLDENPHDETPIGIADGIGEVLSLALDPIGSEDLGGHRALSRARSAFTQLLSRYQTVTGDRKPCDHCKDREVFFSHKDQQWLHDVNEPPCFLAAAAQAPSKLRTYDVTVRRVLYQYATIQIDAEDPDVVQDLAYDTARFGVIAWEDHDPRNPEIEVQEIEEA